MPDAATEPDLCANGRIDPGEQDVDCGGTCAACQTCGDGVQNQNETGVDCGGVCFPCQTCSDGVRNQNETQVDCGGVCGACESCADSVQNQDETGVDCGGVCPACGCVWTPFGAPEKITGLGFGATASQWGPALSPDATTLILSSSIPGGYEDLYVATRPDRGSAFSTASALTDLNTAADEGTAFFTFDGLQLFFFSAKAGGAGARDIYVSTRPNLLDTFRTSSPVAGVNSTGSDHMPWVSPDALSIYFTSSRTGGAGGYDIWMATRLTRNDSFSNVKRLTELATSNNDEGASLMSDELTIFFASDRANGAGASDIWMSTRATKSSAFSTPVNVAVVNSSADELNVAVSADGRELFFTSDRGAGTSSTHVIWRSIRSCQ
jgi:hypothetical protein